MLRNIFVEIIAFFIPNKLKRENFRKHYKRITKQEKIANEITSNIDNYRILLDTVLTLEKKITAIQTTINDIEKIVSTDKVRPLKYWDGYFSTPLPGVYISIACIAKNEGPYIKEWIEYHKIVGVERFYFYDNESTDQTKEILRPYIENGTVIYKYVKGRPMQRQCFNDAVYYSKVSTKWLALIDLDEFLVPVEKDNLPDLLNEYEKEPGLVVQRVIFDSNGHETKPSAHGGLVTANYTRIPKDTMKLNSGFKSIVKPFRVAYVDNAHIAFYRNNLHAVNENFKRIRVGQISDPHGTVNKIRINHYFTKSKEEYHNKILRGSNSNNSLYSKPYLYQLLDLPHSNIPATQDLVIQKFVPRLKAAMGIKE